MKRKTNISIQDVKGVRVNPNIILGDKFEGYASGDLLDANAIKSLVYDDPSDIPDGSITTAKLADGAVNSIKLADGATTTNKIANGTISLNKINEEFREYIDNHPTKDEAIAAPATPGVSGQILKQGENGPEWADAPEGSVMDSEMSDVSENPVKNKVIKGYIDANIYVESFEALSGTPYLNYYGTINSDGNASLSNNVTDSVCVVYNVSTLNRRIIRFSSFLLSSEYSIALLVADNSGKVIDEIQDNNVLCYIDTEYTIPSSAQTIYINYTNKKYFDCVLLGKENISDVKNDLDTDIQNLSDGIYSKVQIATPSTTDYSNRTIVCESNNTVGVPQMTGAITKVIGGASAYEGKVLRLTATAFSDAYPYICLITNSSNKIIKKIGNPSALTYTNYDIQIPVGANNIYISYKESESFSFSLLEIHSLSSEIQAISENIYCDVFEKLEYANVYENMYAYLRNGTVGLNTTSDVRGCRILTYDAVPLRGKTIAFSSVVFSSSFATAVLITNDSNQVIRVIEDSSVLDYENYRIEVPTTAKLLYFNNAMAEQFTFEVNLVEREALSQYKEHVDEQIDKSGVYNRLIGKKCVCFGDSITALDNSRYGNGKEQGSIVKGYESYLRDAGMTVENKGYSGATMREIVNGRILTFNDFSDYDYVTITSGANDSRTALPVGTIQENNFDNSFIGCLQTAIEYILSENPKIKILLITPIRGWIYTPDGYAITPPPAEDGVVEEKYADAIKAVAEYYALPVCDWYKDCGVNIFTRDWYINDPEPDTSATPNPNPLYSLHPTTKGYKRMADLLLPVIANI